jgi:hypothetical protein
MGCIIEFSESLLRFEFNAKGSKQKILVDMLLKYSEMDIADLALALDASVNELQDILDGNYFFVDEQANDLSQLFLIFFGRTFFNKFTLVRNFFD